MSFSDPIYATNGPDPVETQANNRANAIAEAVQIATVPGAAALSQVGPFYTRPEDIALVISQAGLACTLAQLKTIANAQSISIPGLRVTLARDGSPVDALPWHVAPKLRAWAINYCPQYLDPNAERQVQGLENWW